MNVTEALSARRSCRAFKPDPVNRSVILQLLEAAARTPSWANTQPWEVYVAAGDVLQAIKDGFLERFGSGTPPCPDLPRPKSWPEEHKKRTQQLTADMALAAGEAVKQFGQLNLKGFYAPAVIYLCMDKTLTPWSIFDLGAFSQSIMLEAAQRGLSTIPAVNLVHYPDVIRRELGIPDTLSVIFGIAIGYEDTSHPINAFRSARRPAGEFAVLKGFD
ncbi:nitroreductase [Papillibacter cinnamivorans]|uniref:Nitroreductase n=1 Tax=Papillibacter cinnamivorans DSM 12816 TaxID=1122930 RepID=A0A1W1ZQ08_9FIRM|nr:nitroreductase [Papillibacter cinnamivorans]SMC50188.1 Nitroreductase [Papillibacter cinnamivorans DSM 12816]